MTVSIPITNINNSVIFLNIFSGSLSPNIIPANTPITSAGDNFNAGFMLGLLLGLTPDQALLTGMSTSGFYVRNAHSPNFKELYTFMKNWAEDKI